MSLPDDRRLLESALEWTISYLQSVRAHPVLSKVGPGEVTEALPDRAPAEPEAFASILEDLDRIVVPGITHWNHPRFFGYFATSAAAPGIAAELIAAAINANAMLWRTSPAATELEQVVCGWLAEAAGLGRLFGFITDTASTSTLYSLVAARHAAAPEVKAAGLGSAPPMAVYCSREAHSSVDKAVAAIGLGLDNLRKIPVDDELRMDPDALAAAVDEDVSNGVRPAAVVATVGTTASTSVDPVRPIAEVCRRHGMWLHIDAAYAGAAALVPEFRWIFDGAEHADSIVVNPHKWLFVPVDCSVLFLRDPARMREAFSVVPEYLATAEPADNLMDFGISLGRRFRALKLWFTIQSMGLEGIAEAIREHVRLASLLDGWVAAEDDFELLCATRFSVVNFRYAPHGLDESQLDEINRALAAKVNATGEVFVTNAVIGGRLAIHVAIGNLGTTEADVRALWDLVRTQAR
ncbi:MAG: pyridoxal phosphate-dependent decarboxylase family protein [Actinomycetota bacterium]